MIKISQKIAPGFLRFLFVAALLFIITDLSAQRVLLSRNVLADTIKPHYGQNLRHFVHPYLGLGLMAGPSGTGSEILYGVSPNLEIGGRYKLRLARQVAIGCNLSYNLYSYKLRQNNSKILPDTLLHKAERLLFNNITTGLFIRINIGRTGNYIGKFIDLGAYGEGVFYADHFTKDKLPDESIIRTHHSGLNYINNMQYGLTGQLGISCYVFTVKYRLSDSFKAETAYPDLPRWTFGVQMGLHKIN